MQCRQCQFATVNVQDLCKYGLRRTLEGAMTPYCSFSQRMIMFVAQPRVDAAVEAVSVTQTH